MAGFHRATPVHVLNTAFQAADWVAVFMQSYDRNDVAQRVGPVSWCKAIGFSDGCGR
jgi:hypothetical protein